MTFDLLSSEDVFSSFILKSCQNRLLTCPAEFQTNKFCACGFHFFVLVPMWRCPRPFTAMITRRVGDVSAESGKQLFVGVADSV